MLWVQARRKSKASHYFCDLLTIAHKGSRPPLMHYGWYLIWELLNGSPEVTVPEILWCSQYGLETTLSQNE